jgi:ABC-type multidrug transport system ATPase subunit
MNGCSDRPAGLTVTQGRATLLITHDLDGLDQVDEIVILDHGRVAARGTHAELLRSGGLYRQMWRRGRLGEQPQRAAGSFDGTGAGRSSHPHG